MTKIDIFSGFLGAGKTTLIKKLINEAYKDEKLVLIENEFGDIGIDGAFMQDAGIEVTEMNSGCICCSLVGDFGEALKKVLDKFSPDRILIEPSGVGKLSDVIGAVDCVISDSVSLNSYSAVVDAKKCKMYMKNFGEFFNNQIEHSSAVILSHTDAISEEKLSECVSLIKEHNPSAPIVTTSWQELSGKDILDVIENADSFSKEMKKLADKGEHHCQGHHHHSDECDCHEHHDEECKCDEHHHGDECNCHGHHHVEECKCHEHHHGDECNCHEHHHEHHHHADDVFTSWGIETVHSFTKEKLETILKALSDTSVYGTVLRAKGIVRSDGCWIHFDYVPGQIDIRTGSAATTGKICVIGSDISENRLSALFEI